MLNPIHVRGRNAARHTFAFACAALVAPVLPAAAQPHDAAVAPDASEPEAGTPESDAGPQLVPPELLEPPELVYPAGETAHAEVELELHLDEHGAVVASEVTRSAGAAFDAAALEAAGRLRFAPATRDGVPIPAIIPFRFTFVPPPAPVIEAPAPPAPAAPAAAPVPSAVPSDPIGSTEIEVRGAPPHKEPTRHSLELEEVRTVPGTSGDVLRSVETLPGVARPAWGDGMLIVRGSAPEDSLIFVDGTPIPYAYHLGDTSSVVPGDLLERLDFYPGNFGPEYGRGMGGVIDIGLRPPRRDRLGALAQVDVVDGRVMVEGPLGRDTALLLAARRSWLDAWIGSALEDTGTSLETAPTYWDGQLVVEHALSRTTRARLSLFGADDRFTVVLHAPDEHDPVVGGELGGHMRFLRTQLRIETELSPDVRWVNTAWWGFTDADQRFGGDGFAWQQHELGLRSAVRAELARWLTLDAGIDALYARYDVEARFRPYRESNAVPSPYFARPSRSVDAIATLRRPALYAGLELSPVRELKLMPGLRADYADDTGAVTLDPRFTARWDVVDRPRTTLKSGAGLFHQPPLPEQSVKPVGTEGVESSRALHLSAGVEQELLAGIEVGLEAFYKRLSDLIVARTDESRVIGARFENTGDGRVIGLEVLARYRPRGGALSGWLAYTLSRSERRLDPDEPYALFDWDQTHVLSAVAQLELGARWTLGARFRYVTGAPYTPYFGGVVDLDAGAYSPFVSGGYNAGRLDPFHQLDLRIEKTWLLEAFQLAAYLELRNAYNRRSQEGVRYRYDYAEHEPIEGLPILPVLGLRGEL